MVVGLVVVGVVVGAAVVTGLSQRHGLSQRTRIVEHVCINWNILGLQRNMSQHDWARLGHLSLQRSSLEHLGGIFERPNV